MIHTNNLIYQIPSTPHACKHRTGAKQNVGTQNIAKKHTINTKKKHTKKIAKINKHRSETGLKFVHSKGN